VPHPLFKFYLEKAWKYRLVSFPAPELDHIRFNAVLDTKRVNEVVAAKPDRSLYEILEPFRGD
jgi:UDP-glucose 4-epimerase